MFRLIRSLFAKPREPSPLELARAEYMEAAKDYTRAKTRGDTRGVHHAHRRFREATNQILRLELERRA